MIEKILTGHQLRIMDNIKQWQERDVAVKESISSHSYKVTVFARVLIEDLLTRHYPAGTHFEISELKLEVTTFAMFHDWDEVLIGRDLSHNFKYDKKVGERLRALISEYVSGKSEEEFDENSSSADMLKNCVNANVSPLVKSIVKTADWMAMLYYITREISMGNRTLHKEYAYICDNLFKSVEKIRQELCECRRLDFLDESNYEALHSFCKSLILSNQDNDGE